MVPIPATPSLVGAGFCNQWAILDPGANTLGIAFSACGDAMIGG